MPLEDERRWVGGSINYCRALSSFEIGRWFPFEMIPAQVC